MSDGKDNAVLERIESVHIKGFRSLADVKLDNIPNPMVLLGANGAGKSNLTCFFRLLRAMYDLRAEDFILQEGGANDQLYAGSKQTPQIEADVSVWTRFALYGFEFKLKYASGDRLAFGKGKFKPYKERLDAPRLPPVAERSPPPTPYGATESSFFYAAKSSADPRVKETTTVAGDCWRYQFNDTSRDAPIKKRWDVEDNHRLLEHGGNLAPALLRLKEHHPTKYELIRRHVRRILPEFDDFQLEVDYGKTILRWRGRSTGQTFGAHLTSDGSLRCFCLLTLLNLPDEMLPRIILLDEPELGLHPAAIALISHMVKSLARRRQVIVATQSPHFVDAFGLGEMVVLNLREGRTEVDKPDSTKFGHLLKEYSTGELWRKGVLGG